MTEWLPDSEEESEGTYARTLPTGLSWLALAIGDADDPAPPYSNDFVASSAVEDRYGDSIDQQTWRLANYRRNPVALYEHGYTSHGNLVVGRADRVGIVQGETGKQLRARIRWDRGEHNPIGTLVAIQHAEGFRKAVSVGFKPGQAISRTELPTDDPLYVDPNKTPRWKAGYIYKHNELYEISTVAVPGNQEALQLAADIRNSENFEEAIKKSVAEFLPASVKDALYAAIQRDVEFRRMLVAVTLGATPAPSSDRSTQNPAQSWIRGK